MLLTLHSPVDSGQDYFQWPQVWGNELLGVAWVRSATVSRARCAGTVNVSPAMLPMTASSCFDNASFRYHHVNFDFSLIQEHVYRARSYSDVADMPRHLIAAWHYSLLLKLVSSGSDYHSIDWQLLSA